MSTLVKKKKKEFILTHHQQSRPHTPKRVMEQTIDCADIMSKNQNQSGTENCFSYYYQLSIIICFYSLNHHLFGLA